MKDANAKATAGSMACGDMMTFYLKIENGIVTNATFESYGCAANIATGSMVTELIKGKPLEEVKNLTWQEVVKSLGGLPKVKHHCSNLAIDTLMKAISEYEKTGLTEVETSDGKAAGREKTSQVIEG